MPTGSEERPRPIPQKAPRATPAHAGSITRPELRGHDFEVIKNNLRVNLCRSYEIFIGRAKTEVLIEDLLKPAVPVKVPAV